MYTHVSAQAHTSLCAHTHYKMIFSNMRPDLCKEIQNSYQFKAVLITSRCSLDRFLIIDRAGDINPDETFTHER